MVFSALPLAGRTALVTGVSRRRGIGFGVATALATLGAHVFIHHYRPHDLERATGGDDLDAVRAELTAALVPGARMGDLSADLRDPATIEPLLEAATALTGTLDILVCNQAMSGGDGSISDMTPERLDAHWQANARASLLLTAGFAQRAARNSERTRRASPVRVTVGPAFGPFERPTGRHRLDDIGQGHGAMPARWPMPSSKAAIAGITRYGGRRTPRGRPCAEHHQSRSGEHRIPGSETTDRDLSEFEAWLPRTPFGRVRLPWPIPRI